MAVDTQGHLLALHVTPASRDDRAEVGHLTAAIQEAADESIELACVDQGYKGSKPDEAACTHSIAPLSSRSRCITSSSQLPACKTQEYSTNRSALLCDQALLALGQACHWSGIFIVVLIGGYHNM